MVATLLFAAPAAIVTAPVVPTARRFAARTPPGAVSVMSRLASRFTVPPVAVAVLFSKISRPAVRVITFAAPVAARELPTVMSLVTPVVVSASVPPPVVMPPAATVRLWLSVAANPPVPPLPAMDANAFVPAFSATLPAAPEFAVTAPARMFPPACVTLPLAFRFTAPVPAFSTSFKVIAFAAPPVVVSAIVPFDALVLIVPPASCMSVPAVCTEYPPPAVPAPAMARFVPFTKVNDPVFSATVPTFATAFPALFKVTAGFAPPSRATFSVPVERRSDCVTFPPAVSDVLPAAAVRMPDPTAALRGPATGNTMDANAPTLNADVSWKLTLPPPAFSVMLPLTTLFEVSVTFAAAAPAVCASRFAAVMMPAPFCVTPPEPCSPTLAPDAVIGAFTVSRPPSVDTATACPLLLIAPATVIGPALLMMTTSPPVFVIGLTVSPAAELAITSNVPFAVPPESVPTPTPDPSRFTLPAAALPAAMFSVPVPPPMLTAPAF